MQYVLLFSFLVFSTLGTAQRNSEKTPEDIVITTHKGETQVKTNEDGVLLINVSPKDINKHQTKGVVSYTDFGAKGDGKTDDIEAIAATHAFANKYGIEVKANSNATYYISGKNRTVIIETNTDFGKASFIVDDTDVEKHNANIFMVASTKKPFNLEGITSLRKNQKKIDVNLPDECIVFATNSDVKQYIRYGANQNKGSAQRDVFIVDKEGNLDMNAPIIWDFDKITEITALPIDDTILTIKGGRFTTIANRNESKFPYYARGILIKRSNVVIDSLEHHITGEGDTGSPYSGFINISDCANITVKNTVLTGHKMYNTIGSAGTKVAMGTYDISISRALNISFINCSQTNDINNSEYWGIMGSNFCKNILYDNCIFSRFDAHMGVANATIRNSTLGHQGINAIGTGTFILENSTVRASRLINLRSDYGSIWDGEMIVRNCVFVPADGRSIDASLFTGHNSGQHDFGYTCYMPERITIESLYIDDSNHPEDYEGPSIFANFNSKMTDESYVEEFPFILTKEVFLKDITTASGKPLKLSKNPFMFRNVKVINK